MSGLVVQGFAGPGGWCEGLRLAGYRGRSVGFELDATACATGQAAGHQRVRADVADVPLDHLAGKVDGLIQSPPCQPFSKGGLRRGLDDSRGQLVWQPLRWAIALRPRWVACEQVVEVLPIWRAIASELRSIGYQTWTGVLNAADYGVPQTRFRALLLGRLDGPVVAPEPTHSEDATAGLFDTRSPWVSMADATGWDPRSLVGFPRRADTPSNGVGGVVSSGDHRVVELNGIPYRSRDLRRASLPAQTVTGKVRSWKRYGPDGTSEPLTIREAGLLQSFPADYPWRGSRTQQLQQVADAIPPALACAVLAPLLAGSGALAAGVAA